MVTYKQASNANLIIVIAVIAITFGGGYISAIALEWLFPYSLIIYAVTAALVLGLCYSGYIFSKMIDEYDFKK